MTSLLGRALGRHSDAEERSSGFDQSWPPNAFTFGGISYPIFGSGQMTGDVERTQHNFTQYVQQAYKANGVIFSVILSRLLLFSEVRFQWQRINNGRPGDLFGTPELGILETPWPNGTTGELLAKMEQDVSLAGNCYIVRDGDRLRRLRPDWVDIVLTAPPEEAAASDVAGYRYRPGGDISKATPVFYLPENCAHWSPIPDPEAQYRGMSWLTPVLAEIQADKGATEHKRRFFLNAATPNMAVLLPAEMTKTQFEEFKSTMNAGHQGVSNAYKTLYLGGGADVKTLGAHWKELDFKATQGAGETRIAAAGGVPPIIVGLSEGLAAGTYNNFGQARRLFGDKWARPQWRSACAALSVLVQAPSTGTPVRLWYDSRDVTFLLEDQADAADVQNKQANTFSQLVSAGYEPNSVRDAIEASDWSLLVHTGLFSVQLQPPTDGTMPGAVPIDQPTPPDPAPAPDPNQDGGNGNPA
ncbi:MAG: RoPhREQ1 gp68 [Actinomycetia bacterium]|nr:RoPhREQ1 gp68 [Actinomycetes bacterium]